MKSFFYSVKQAGARFVEDQAQMQAAALAYYAAFSIAPLLVIALGAASLIMGPSAGERVFDLMNGSVGPQGAAAVRSMMDSATSAPGSGAIATIIGAVTLVFGAAGAFLQLQQSLNNIWRVTADPRAGWPGYLRQRLLAFGAVAAIGPILLLTMAASTGVSAAGGVLPGGPVVWTAVNYAVSLAILGAVFAAMFKLLPDVRLSWGDVGAPGLMTALLFVLGNAAVGVYLSRAGVASSYGAAGSLIVVLMWVFYSAQIILFGAELSRARATRGGRRVETKAGTVRSVPATASVPEKETPHERRGRERVGAP